MNTYDLILLVVYEGQSHGIKIGRTLLQKKLFLLNELLEGKIKYFPHFYGPYSREVASIVDSLVATDLLDEIVENIPEYKTPWGDSTRYSYRISDPEQIVKLIKTHLGHEYTIALKALQKINEQPGANNYKSISIAAKVKQILKEKGTLKVSDFSKEASKLGWKLNPAEITDAVNFLKDIGLLSIVSES